MATKKIHIMIELSNPIRAHATKVAITVNVTETGNNTILVSLKGFLISLAKMSMISPKHVGQTVRSPNFGQC